MGNYTKSGNPPQGGRGISKEIRDEFAAIETAVNSKADIDSPAFTGTPTAPTPTLGDSSTKLATTAFVAGTASSASLPGQLGNAGKFLITDGTNASWEHAQVITRNTQTAAYTAVAGDRGDLINWTGSSNATLSLTAAATLGDGWYCYVKNAGTAVLTIDPNGAETIDGATTLAVYPGQICIVQCNGSNFSTMHVDKTARIFRSDRTSNTQLDADDVGVLINITSGTFTQTFAAAASLGDGWWCYIHNSGTGDITLDPNGAETIDGLSNFIMYPGEVRKVICDGVAFRTVVLSAFYRTFTSSDTFTRPPGYRLFEGLLWGGGGSGRKGGSTPGGGGGGACHKILIPSSSLGATVPITIGAGGAGITASNTNGNNGGNSTFSSFTAYGGGGGSASGAGGGGTMGAPSGVSGGSPAGGAGSGSSTYGGGGGSVGSSPGGHSYYGGGGGGDGIHVGGDSFFGGGGGGGTGSGGASTFGGSGGAGSSASSGTAGTAPGGGGGATDTGTTSGAGARGQLDIWGII